MSWERVIGHHGPRAALERAARRQRLGHAYLFTGPAGIGKHLFARQLARCLLCENPPAERWDACGLCPACKLVDAQTHPDFFQVAKPEDRQEMPIERMRQLTADLALKPARGARKIAIIDDADDFNEESGNCFLKTLEEPPPGSLLILINTRIERLLRTIRSRCQWVRFAPLTDAELERWLRTQPEIEESRIRDIVARARGRIGLARILADPALAEFDQSLRQALGQAKPDVFPLIARFQERVQDAGKDTAAQRERSQVLMRMVMEALREAHQLSVTGAEGDGAIAAIARRHGTESLQRRIELCLEAERMIERRVQLVLVIEWFATALLTMERDAVSGLLRG